ncbi:hypothetical protein FKW77_004344 [Venturia effusa]|uniref:Zn(2)-C6 fungal-type domain-containing protein n=1 Tax=Venturia effusa TaxID=50376 RepID=A0A517KW67_9PEZI|nr:hypothetical protein FKW77_004344 [Venturia effusa]
MTQSWLPRDPILDRDLIERLFAWHGTPPENQEACRNDFLQVDRNALQDVIQPLVNVLPQVSGKGGTSLQAKAERALLVPTDLDLMWEAFGAQTKVERKDFRRCIETAPPDVFIGLLQHCAKLGDMSPLHFRTMNIEQARQFWAKDSWKSIDNGLGRFLASIRKGGKPTRAAATIESNIQPTQKAPATLRKKKSKPKLPSSLPSPLLSPSVMPSSPPILISNPPDTRAPTIPTPQTEDDRVSEDAFARAAGNVTAVKRKRLISTEGTPNTLRKGIEDEALARAMGHATARKSKPTPSTKETPGIALSKTKKFVGAVENTTSGKKHRVQSIEGTPSTGQKSFVDEVFARAMDSAAGKRKRAPSSEETPDFAPKDIHNPKRQRLTKDASSKSSRPSLGVPQVETRISGPVPVPSREMQKLPHNPQQLSKQPIPRKCTPPKETLTKKEATGHGRPPGLRELPGSKELPYAKRPKAVKSLIVEKPPKTTLESEGSRLGKPSNRERLSAHEVSKQLEEASVRPRRQDDTKGNKRRRSKATEADLADSKNPRAHKRGRTEEEIYWREKKQRDMVVDERDTIEYWREVEAKYLEEEKLRDSEQSEQPEPVLPPPGSQEVHRRELDKILIQRRLAEEQRSQQRSQQKDASQRRKSQTGTQDSERKRRKQSKNQQRKRRREAQAALARLQNRSPSPVKRWRDATGTVSPPPIREVDRPAQANEHSPHMQDEGMVDSRRQNMSSSDSHIHNESEIATSNAVEESSSVAQHNNALAIPAGPSTPSVRAPACKACRLKHRACDRVHPDCGECLKHEVRCVWDRDTEVSVQKPKGSSHKKKPKSLVPEPKACRTCNVKHRRCDRIGPICGECSKSGRECVWAADAAVSNALGLVEATVPVEEPEQMEQKNDDEPERDEVPEHIGQPGQDEELEHEESPEERDMRQIASQLTTTQDEPASSTLLALASPPARKSQRFSQTITLTLPPAHIEPVAPTPENVYTSSQASILERSKANIIARMKSNMACSQASTASKDPGEEEDGEEDGEESEKENVQSENTPPVERRVMVAVEVPPATFFGRLDSENHEANKTTPPNADTGEAGTNQYKDEEEGNNLEEPAKSVAAGIADDEDTGEDDASDVAREDSEDLILHDISGYDSADAEDEDLRDSEEEEDDVETSTHRYGRARGASQGFVDDMASEDSDEEEEERESHGSDEETEHANEEGEEEVETPAINWGESSDDEDDEFIPGVRHVVAQNVTAPHASSELINLVAKPIIPAQTQTPEPEDTPSQSVDAQNGKHIELDTKLFVPADDEEQEATASAYINKTQQSPRRSLEQRERKTGLKSQSRMNSSFDPDRHRSLRDSLVNAIQKDDDSKAEINARPAQLPRSASPELGEDNLLALSPSIFRHDIRGPSTEVEDGKHVLEVAESVYGEDDHVHYPRLEDKLGRVPGDQPEDDIMDVDNESIASVGDRPVRDTLVTDAKSPEIPRGESDVQMIDDDSDFSEDELAGAEEFPQSKPLEDYPDDVKFEPSQLEAMSPPERLTQLQLPALPPGMVASQYPADFYPSLPTMGNVLSSAGEGNIIAMVAINHFQTSPATSSSDDASVVTALEYSQPSPESKSKPEAMPVEETPCTDPGPTHIAEHVNKNMVTEHTAVLKQEEAMGDEDDWTSEVARTRLRNGRLRQETAREDIPTPTQSFRESQGLVRCSIKESGTEMKKPQKGRKARKTRKTKAKASTVAKARGSDVVVANTQLTADADSPGIEHLRSQPSDQAIVLETQSSAVPDSAPAKSDSGPVYDECSTRGVDFTWERNDGGHPSPPRPYHASQHGADEAISPEKSAKSQPLCTPSKRKTAKASSFFDTPSPKKPRPAAGTVSCIDVPPLSDAVFGLVQEELAHDPFQLLVAVIFLNKTRGKYAIPVFREVIEAYPTPQALENADSATLSDMIKPLGLFNQRAATLVDLARVWNLHPPTKGRRVMTPKYPKSDSHKGIDPMEVLGDDDAREGALEIGHLPGIGAYAFDSWRIFCRDELRAVATDWNGGGASEEDFVPEWKRVLPKDKELRAYLRWMWLKEGVKWNPLTGEKDIASAELLRAAELGGLDWDEVDAM